VPLRSHGSLSMNPGADGRWPGRPLAGDALPVITGQTGLDPIFGGSRPTIPCCRRSRPSSSLGRTGSLRYAESGSDVTDRALLSAAALLAITTTATTVVSLREPQLPDEPFGLRFPGRVPVHLALGLGSGVAVPWPMPVIATVAALRAQPGLTWPRRTCAIIGATVLIGTLAEPASWGMRPRSRPAEALVPLLFLSGAALFVAGTRERSSAA
jgi:hypothetical protein